MTVLRYLLSGCVCEISSFKIDKQSLSFKKKISITLSTREMSTSSSPSYVYCICDFTTGQIPTGWVDWVKRIQNRMETLQWETSPPTSVENSNVVFMFYFG